MSMELIKPDEFELTQRISKSLVASAFFQVSGKSEEAIAQAVVKVLAGRELGIQPVAAMMGVNVIQGRVSLSAQLMLACAKRAGYSYRIHEAEGWCEIDWFRDGKLLGKAGFHIDEAKAAGLVKPGGNWTKYPKDMLFWRAVSRGVRRFCPDATAGMAVYAPDELGVEVDPESSEVSGMQGSREQQAEVMQKQLESGGMSAEDAAAEAAKFAAPKAKKGKAKPEPAEPKPEKPEITDEDLPPELRGRPTEAELDMAMAKQEKAGVRLNW